MKMDEELAFMKKRMRNFRKWLRRAEREMEELEEVKKEIEISVRDLRVEIDHLVGGEK